MGKHELPSNKQIDGNVILNFYGCGKINNCKITKVIFSKGKVLYDVEIDVLNEENEFVGVTRVHSIDSVFVQ